MSRQPNQRWMIQYIGSFEVKKSGDSTAFVQEQLRQLRHVPETKEVLLVISLAGIKMCSREGSEIYMAHALKRVSYASCTPEYRQFAFVAREPRRTTTQNVGNSGTQYCHIYRASTEQQAEDINAIVGNAFRAAYLKRHDDDTQLELNNTTQYIQMPDKQVHEPDINCRHSVDTTSPTVSTSQTQSIHSDSADDQTVNETKTLEITRIKRRSKSAQPENKKKTTFESEFLVPTRLPPKPNELNKAPSAELIDNHTTNIRPSKSTAQFLKRLFGSIKERSHSVASISPVHRRRPVSEIFSSALRLTPKNTLHHRPATPLGILKKRQNSHSPNSATKSSRQPTLSRSNPRASVKRQLYPIAPISNSEDVHATKSISGSDMSITPLNGRSLMCPSTSLGGPIVPTPHRRTTVNTGNEDRLCPFTDDEMYTLQKLPWYCGDLSRDEIVTLLRRCEQGAFVIRRSSTQPCCLALSVRVPDDHNQSGVSHYLIMSTENGFKLKGTVKNFVSIQSLVTHHSVIAEQLPCRLKFTNWHPRQFPTNRLDQLNNNNKEKKKVEVLIAKIDSAPLATSTDSESMLTSTLTSSDYGSVK